MKRFSTERKSVCRDVYPMPGVLVIGVAGFIGIRACDQLPAERQHVAGVTGGETAGNSAGSSERGQAELGFAEVITLAEGLAGLVQTEATSSSG